MLADAPYPSGASAGRVLNSFNWTIGTISGKVGPVQQPPQVLKLEQNGWWSMEQKPNEGWQACLQYNELLEDAKTSYPHTGFEACVSYGGGLLDLTRGTTPNLDAFAMYGQSNGWNEKGYDPHAAGVIWGQFIIWSNSTVAH